MRFAKDSPMLVSLLYVSQPTGPVTTSVTGSILRSSIANNKAADISGVLCQGTGLYMQVLEGERRVVNDMFYRIVADSRHRHVELLSMEEIQKRQFDQWSMALVHLNANDPMVKMNHPEFNPYASTAKDAMAILEELVKTSWPIVTTEP